MCKNPTESELELAEPETDLSGWVFALDNDTLCQPLKDGEVNDRHGFLSSPC